MSTATMNYAASANLTITGLDSLATSSTLVSGWESGTIDNTTDKFMDILVSGKITVAAVGLSAGTIALRVVPMMDDTNYPGGFDGTVGTETTPLDDENGTAAGSFLLWSTATDTTASQVYYIRPMSVASACGYMPAKFVLFLAHSTGANLAASGNQITTKGMKYDVA